MFKNLLASVGIGAATVDTRLDQEVLRPGERFTAQIVIKGGDVDQEIDGLQLQLVAHVKSGDFYQDQVIWRWKIDDEFTIKAGEEKIIPFQGTLHHETPVTEYAAPIHRCKVWLRTGLSIDNAIDAKDLDGLRVAPTPAMEAVLTAVHRCGFEMKELTADTDRIGGADFRAELACDQEFVFRPARNSRWSFSELEVHFLPRAERTWVLLEFDFRYRSEVFRSFWLEHHSTDDSEAIAARIERIVSEVA